MAKDYYQLCEQFVEKHRSSKREHTQLLDAMLCRVAIETSENNYTITVPLEQLFTHLKQQTKCDIQMKRDSLKRLEQCELVKIMKGKA